MRSPVRLLAAARLALSTSRPGTRGLLYQSFYFVEAILAADFLRRNAISHVHNHIGDHSGTVTMLAARLAGIGYSITFHGWPGFLDAKYSRIKEKVRGARFTRSISYFCRSQLMMFSQSDDLSRFKVVHCGLEIAKYGYRPPRQEIRYLLCVARLSLERASHFLFMRSEYCGTRVTTLNCVLPEMGRQKRSKKFGRWIWTWRQGTLSRLFRRR